MIDESLLLKHRFFRDIGEPLLGYIAGCAEQVSYPADTQLLAQGQPAHSMLAIEHGKVGVGIHVPQRGFVTIETVQAGEIVGWSWLFPPYEWSFDAITTTDVSGSWFTPSASGRTSTTTLQWDSSSWSASRR